MSLGLWFLVTFTVGFWSGWLLGGPFRGSRMSVLRRIFSGRWPK